MMKPNKAFMQITNYNEKMNRHSSHLAIRKNSNEKVVSPRQHDEEIHNIRRTSFWMKKTMFSQDIENIIPNQGKKPRSARSRKVLSMKIKTNGSDAQSIFQKQSQFDNSKDINSKLVLIEKYQQEVGDQVQLMNECKQPKLSQIQHLFKSLNRILKMITKCNLKQAFPIIDPLIKRHIDSTQHIFMRLKTQATDFISSNKCEDLIAKSINLEKQNGDLLDRLIICENKLKNLTIARKQQSTPLNSIFDLNHINFEKIYQFHAIDFKNHKTSVYNQNHNGLLFDSLFQIVSQKNLKKQKFSIFNKFLDKFLQTQNHNFQAFKKFIDCNRKQDNKNFTFFDSQMRQYFSQNAIFDILNYKFNQDIFEHVRKTMENQSKIYEKIMESRKNKEKIKQIRIIELLNFSQKFRILKKNEKYQQILICLCKKIKNFEGQHLCGEELSQIERFICSKQKYFEKQQVLGLKQKSKNEKQIQNMKSKRLINCVSLFQGRSSVGKSFPIRKKNLIDKENIHNDEVNEQKQSVRNFLSGYIKVDKTQAYLFYYYLIKEQLDYIEKALAVYLRVDVEVEVSQFLQKLIETQKIKLFENKGGFQQIEGISSVTGYLVKAFGYSRSLMEQTKQMVAKQMVKVIILNLFPNQ